MLNVSFFDSSTQGDYVLQLSVSARDKNGIRMALGRLIADIDSSYDIHVITPTWNGEEF